VQPAEQLPGHLVRPLTIAAVALLVTYLIPITLHISHRRWRRSARTCTGQRRSTSRWSRSALPPSHTTSRWEGLLLLSTCRAAIRCFVCAACHKSAHVCAPPAPATSLHDASPWASAVSLAMPITSPCPALGRFLPPQSAQAQLVRGQAELQQREEAWSQESRAQKMVRRACTPCWGRSCVGDATGGLAVRACRRLARSASRAASCTRCHACDVPAV
jgi:hypothetical protein